MLRLYDPISKNVYVQEESRAPTTLQSQSRKAVVQSFTLRCVERIKDLPLPETLKRKVGTLSMKDFLIDVERLRPVNHTRQCYPAYCCLNNQDVIIKIFPKYAGVSLSDYNPSLIASFAEDDHLCCVFLPTQSLAEKVDKAKETENSLDPSIIWQTLSSIVNVFQSNKISPISIISSTSIQFHTTGQITVNCTQEDSEQITAFEARLSTPVYEAPEVINRQNPDSKAHSWNLGCLLYEMLALEPAFYDRSGENPFSVFIDIMQGNMPSVPDSGSESLTDLVTHCLVSSPTDRYSLQDITDAIILHNAKNL